jgi:hypothetical protein
VLRQEAADHDDEAAVALKVETSAASSSSQTATGICVSFKVDTDAEAGGGDKAMYFAKYLAARALQIEVWDADAHILVGTLQVDLRLLLRQGREAIQSAGEYSVTDSSLSLPVDGAGGGVRHRYARRALRAPKKCPVIRVESDVLTTACGTASRVRRRRWWRAPLAAFSCGWSMSAAFRWARVPGACGARALSLL